MGEFVGEMNGYKFVLLCFRDLPQFCHSHWQSHFGKAFDVYTKVIVH